jgi:hypothetical protein
MANPREHMIRPRCRAALKQGECDRTPCESKAAVLDLIRTGAADMMVVISEDPLSWIPFGELPKLEHVAIRFHDRALGDAARELSLDGFKLRHALH